MGRVTVRGILHIPEIPQLKIRALCHTTEWFLTAKARQFHIYYSNPFVPVGAPVIGVCVYMICIVYTEGGEYHGTWSPILATRLNMLNNLKSGN